jgi:hypothetical protein
VSRGSEEDDGSAGEEEGGVFRAGEEGGGRRVPWYGGAREEEVDRVCILPVGKEKFEVPFLFTVRYPNYRMHAMFAY